MHTSDGSCIATGIITDATLAACICHDDQALGPGTSVSTAAARGKRGSISASPAPRAPRSAARHSRSSVAWKPLRQLQRRQVHDQAAVIVLVHFDKRRLGPGAFMCCPPRPALARSALLSRRWFPGPEARCWLSGARGTGMSSSRSSAAEATEAAAAREAAAAEA
eukprot:tig00000489_g1363.t1